LTDAIKETLIIRNPTQLPISFKVKTTAPRQYCVRPNSGRIEPGQELEIQGKTHAHCPLPLFAQCRVFFYFFRRGQLLDRDDDGIEAYISALEKGFIKAMEATQQLNRRLW
jgi:hypothetical protein